jgi:hypothetical protein
MATGPEHYREAERIIQEAFDNHSYEDIETQVLLAAADVHATLALAAATALHPREALTTQFRDQVAAPWVEVAG